MAATDPLPAPQDADPRRDGAGRDREMIRGRSRVIGMTRWLGALMLALSLCLPMYSCTTTAPREPGESASAPPRTQTDYYYAWSTDRANDPAGYLVLAVFLWPLGATLLSRLPRHRRTRDLRLWLQGLPIAGTAYLVYVIGWTVGRPAAGAWLAASGILLYVAAWLADIARMLRSHPTGPPPA